MPLHAAVIAAAALAERDRSTVPASAHLVPQAVTMMYLPDRKEVSL